MRPSLALILSALGLGCGASVTSNPPTGSDVPPTTDTPVAVVDTPPPVDVSVIVEDVPPPPVDVPVVTGDLEIGAPCMLDRECQSGVCANTPGVIAGCAQPCAIDEDCSGGFNCVLDRAPGGGRLVCGQVAAATSEAAGDCSVDTDCVWGFCLDGLCRNPCSDDGACTAGWRCGPQAVGARSVQVCRANPITGVTVEDYTLFEALSTVDRGTPPLPVVAPPDTVSLTWVTQDLEGSDLLAAVSSVTSPNGDALVDLRSWNVLREQPIRVLPTRPQINVATFPGRDMQPMVPGVFRSAHALVNSRDGTPVTSRRMRALVRVKRAPGGVAANGWTLRVRVIIGGIAGLNATNARTNTRLQNAFARMASIYQTVGVTVFVDGYADMNAADAARFASIDSPQELRELYTRSAGVTPDSLVVFLVRGISSTAGLENAIGIAGAIDGPPGINGTVASGVVASWDNTGGRNDLLGQVLAHECGHYLGLWHVRERLNACTTATQMDCSIWGGVDNLTDTPTTAAASQYLMFWTTDGSNNRLTANQGLMMRVNPMVH